ncbi:unnamed protein product [Closterium sp. NIES-54]
MDELEMRWVWGCRAFVRDTSADKLSTSAIPCDVTFDESVPFYNLFPYSSPPPPPPQLFLAPGPPPVAVGSRAAPGAAFGGAGSEGAEPGGAESEGAGSGGAKPGGAEPGGAEPAGVEPGGAEPAGVEPGHAESEGAESAGAEPRGTASSKGPASSGGPAGASLRLSPRPEPLSPQQLHEWFARRTRLLSGAAGAGDSAAGDTRAGGAGVTAVVGGAGGVAALGPGGARTRGTGAVGTGGVGGARAGDPTELGAAGAGGAGAVGTGAGGTGAGGAGAGGAGAVDIGARASPLPAPSPYIEQTGGLTERREPASRPASPVRTGRRVPHPRPPPVLSTHAMALRPSSIPLRVPLPPPPESSLPAVPDPESDRACAASPTISPLLSTVVIDPSFESTTASALVVELVDFAAACPLDYATDLVATSESASPPSVAGECALGTDVLEDRQEDFECLAAAVPRFASMLLPPEGDLDAPDIPTPRFYAGAITGPYSSQWQAAMDAEMASWKSTGTYVDAVPSSRANIGVDYFQAFSPTPKMTTLEVLLHVAAQRDYELHSVDFSTAFWQGSLHEEIWLRCPPGFTGSFPAGTQWSLRRPVYGLRQAPREWHDTLRTTLAALGFTPSTADPSLFLRTDTSLPPF